MNSDFKELLAVFNEFGVKYLVIGGYAVIKYGNPRFTGDLDLWIEASIENGSKVYNALLKFGGPVTSLAPSDFSTPGFFFQMGTPPNRVDILMSISGADFPSSYSRKEYVTLEGAGAVPFISLLDLLATKKAAGRKKDLLDLEILEQIAATRTTDKK